jgi:hypothetical protein
VVLGIWCLLESADRRVETVLSSRTTSACVRSWNPDGLNYTFCCFVLCTSASPFLRSLRWREEKHVIMVQSVKLKLRLRLRPRLRLRLARLVRLVGQ